MPTVSTRDDRLVSIHPRRCSRCGVTMKVTAMTTRDDVSFEEWTCPACGVRLRANFHEAWDRSAVT